MNPDQSTPYRRAFGATPRERAVSAFLSLAICLLLAFVLVRMGAFNANLPGNGSRLVAIDVSEHDQTRARTRTRGQRYTAVRPEIERAPSAETMGRGASRVN